MTITKGLTIALAVALITLGVVILVDPFSRAKTSRHNPAPVTLKADDASHFPMAQTNTPQIVESAEQERLIVPSVAVDLPIYRGIYSESKKTWLVPGNAAYLADGSSAPNSFSGTTYVYGHNNKKVFAPLKSLHAGDIAIVKTNENSFYYELTEMRTATPDDVSQISTNGTPRLLLQTCTGLRYEYRAQFIFKLVRVA